MPDQLPIDELEPKANPRALPSGWRWARLGEVCELNPRRPPDLARAADAPTTFVPMQAVDETHGAITRPELRPFKEVQKGYTYFGEGDVLFAKITPCMQNGKHAIARDLAGGFGFGSTEFHVLRPGPAIAPEWVHFFIRQPSVLEKAKSYFTGAVGQQRVPESYLVGIDVPLPPLDEQKRITAFLNERMAVVERARAAAEAQLEATKALPAAYLRAAFSSPEAQQWPVKPFGELVENFDGRRVPVKLDERRGRKGVYPYYGASGVIDYIDEFLYEGDFLLIGEDGANLILRSSPIAFRASGRFWVNNHAHVVQPKSIVSLDYLLHFFALTDLRPYVTGAAQPKLTQEDMNSIPVPLPPERDQQRITSMLNEQVRLAEGVGQAMGEALQAVNKLPAALSRRAFDGEL